MFPNSEKILSTAKIDGGAYRWLELADGSGRVERWKGGKWAPGGAELEEFATNPPVSPSFAVRVGIPPSDLTIEALRKRRLERWRGAANDN